MFSKSSWLSTVSVPPRRPPLSDSDWGVFRPLLVIALELVPEPLEPHADRASANTPPSAMGATALIFLDMAPPVLAFVSQPRLIARSSG